MTTFNVSIRVHDSRGNLKLKFIFENIFIYD